MFILFGIRTMNKRLGTVLMMCQSCHRPCSHVVGRRQTWFTLFFIPLIPFKTTYYTVCSMCSASFKYSKENAAHLVQVGAEQQAAPPEMTPDGPLSASPMPTIEATAQPPTEEPGA